jgi:hypothetical protein
LPNYCTKSQAARLCGKLETAIEQDWLDWIDAKIDQHAGCSYKGTVRVWTARGDGNELIRLPSRAASITSITEDGVTLSSEEYELEPNSRYIQRASNLTLQLMYGYGVGGRWYNKAKYVITYVEPAAVPENLVYQYELTAAQAVAVIAMYADKQEDFGIALTVSDAGTANKTSTAEANSFPASMLEEIDRTIKRGIPKTGV